MPWVRAALGQERRKPMKNQRTISAVSLFLVLLVGMTQQAVGQNLEITASEKEAISHILTSGPSDRFMVKDLEAQEAARKGIKKFTLGGPPPGTTLIILKEDKEKGGYSVTSNVAFFSPGPMGLESKIPNFSDLLKGDIIRFLGNVVLGTCKLEACTFYGELDDPLSFAWVPDKGMAYLGGKGFVKLSDGTNVMLPRPSKMSKEGNSRNNRRKEK
jgi:hypothetical protein